MKAAINSAMAWIKKNYDQFILGLVALLLMGLSIFIVLSANAFKGTFAGVEAQVFKNNNVPPIDMTSISGAVDASQKPAFWDLTDTEGSLFVSIPYIGTPDHKLIDPRTGPPIHPPVPNTWIINNKLDILDNNVLNEDPSGDGFTNFDKWKGLKGDGSDSYNPHDKNSHPPYWTKLRLIQYIRQPFRLKFAAYDGDPTKPDSMDFQINTLDLQGPSQMGLHVGDMIKGTKFKLIKFESKTTFNPTTTNNDDTSVLTIQNTEEGDLVPLTLNQEANSPDSYADFKYLWNDSEFQVRKGKPFVLLPEATLRYILIDITDDNAVIQTPAGDKVTVPKLQQ